MAKPVEKRFLFTGKAVALGGRLRRQGDRLLDGNAGFINGEASSCIPITGGRATGTSKGRSYHRGLIQFGKASSEAHGDYDSPAKALEYTRGNHGENELGTATTVKCSLASLKLRVPGEKGADGKLLRPRSFEARKLAAILGTTCDRSQKKKRIAVSISGITFDGLKVDGHSLIVKLKADKDLQLSTAESRRPVVRTFVEALSFKGDKAPDRVEIVKPNILKIQGLGVIHFGEIFVIGNSRRLTLLRFQLGSPIGGELAAVDAQVDGTTVPP
jgi:hypothetical protein